MKTKNELAIKLTEENRLEVFNLLNEFNQPMSWGVRDFLNGDLEVCFKLLIFYSDEFFGVQKNDDTFGWYGSKEIVSVDELRQILAVENLKDGDIFIGNNGDYEFISVYSSITPDGQFIVSNWTGFNGNNMTPFSNYDTSGYISRFVRYATPEEAKVFQDIPTYSKPSKELEVGKWYRWIDTEISNNIVYKKDKTGGYGIWNNVWCDYLVCDIATNWIEATEQEICEVLDKECISRYGEDWRNVKIVAHADKRSTYSNDFNFYPTLHPEYIRNNHGVIYYKGVWAEPLKEEITCSIKGSDLQLLLERSNRTDQPSPEPKTHWLIRNWSKISIAIDTINLVGLVYFGSKMVIYGMLDKTWESVGYLAVALFYAWVLRINLKK